MMHILIAPNAFKNALSAADAAEAIELGLRRSKLACTTARFPVADGGDGTGMLIIEHCGGKIIPCKVHDPLGRIVTSQFGLINDGSTAVIEMSDASGIRLLRREELNPMRASSAGAGELIKYALDAGALDLVLAMGGSATVDGGCGILRALGARFYDAAGGELTPEPENIMTLDRIDVSGLDSRLGDCALTILCDVNNQLLGTDGAAVTFGPQKGASPQMVARLDAFLTRLSAIALKQTGKDIAVLKFGGTAGGAAAGLHAFANARLVNGIEYFMMLTGFESELAKCDLLITGEGSIDSQTLQGKGPFGVAKMAKERGIPVIGLAGRIPMFTNAELNNYFDVLIPVGNGPEELHDAIKNTHENLSRTAESIGNLLAMQK